MSKSLYEIVTYNEFVRIGHQLKSSKKELQKEAKKVLLSYHKWQSGLLSKEQQQAFEEAVKQWRQTEGLFPKAIKEQREIGIGGR